MWICMAVLEDGEYCEHCNEDSDEICASCGRIRPSPVSHHPLQRLVAWFSQAIFWDRAPR